MDSLQQIYPPKICAYSELERIDLSNNSIDDATGIKGCAKLNWINISKNKLSDMNFVSSLKNVTVLNLGYNNITDMSPVSHLSNLKALILNNNNIKSVVGIEMLCSLSTLVLSHNQIEDIDISMLSDLFKLQLSHNMFKSFPNLQFNTKLFCLSLNDNQIKSISEDFVLGARVNKLDLGNNKIRKLKNIRALVGMKTLKTLNLKGNETCGHPSYTEQALNMFPGLRKLDTNPVEKLRESLHNMEESSISRTIQEAETKPNKRHFENEQRKETKTDKTQDESSVLGQTKPSKKKKRKNEHLAEGTSMVAGTGDKNRDTLEIVPMEEETEKHKTVSSSKPEEGSPKKRNRNNDQVTHMKEISHLPESDKVKRKKDKKKRKDKKGADKTSQGVSTGVVAIKNINKHELKHKDYTTENIFEAFDTNIGLGESSSW